MPNNSKNVAAKKGPLVAYSTPDKSHRKNKKDDNFRRLNTGSYDRVKKILIIVVKKSIFSIF